MRLASIRAGDLVRCDVRGRCFYAKVTGRDNQSLAVEPLTREVTYRIVTSRQVVEHYRRARQRTSHLDRQEAHAA